MELTEHQNGDVTVIQVKGRIDSNTSKILGKRFTDVVNAGRPRLVVDFQHTLYISSAGFRALLIAGRVVDESGGRLVLCGLSPELRRLFDLGVFTDLFLISPSQVEAVVSCQGNAT